MVNHLLDGVRVVEFAGVEAEYAGLVLAGLGADVIKVEPPQGSPTRAYPPFLDDIGGTDRSLHFWAYNRGKRSIVLDLARHDDQIAFRALLAGADVFIDGSPRDYLSAYGLSCDNAMSQLPTLVIARMSAFGDYGPWMDFKGSDLVHLALGGEMMNCGYTPRLDGTYDVAPIAGQAQHAYHIAGEQLALATVAALHYRARSGQGQLITCAVHEAVAKNTEIDVSSWIYRRAPVFRQTCQHAAERVAKIAPIVHTKDGRWFLVSASRSRERFEAFMALYGMDQEPDETPDTHAVGVPGRSIPGTGNVSDQDVAVVERLQRLFSRFTYAEAPWKEAQEAGILIAPVRRPEENTADEHWLARDTFSEIEHSEIGRRFTYVTSKWLSSETAWSRGTRAPLLGEHTDDIRAAIADRHADDVTPVGRGGSESQSLGRSAHNKPMALDGVRIFDFSWFLASAGGTRFLAAMGAEVIKVEWAAHPDTRLGVMAPEGGRAARDQATSPLPGVSDANMGGQFNNKNSGKRGISLNVRHPEGMAIARRLIGISDVVAEGFSPGVMRRWGLGYDELRLIKPDIIYAQQSGMGEHGKYGRFRAVGVIAASLAGETDMAGLPEPAMPAGWGYSYLDWIGAYSFALAITSALLYRQRTGKGQWIDASQTESGLFIEGLPILNYSANGRRWERCGNRSPWGQSAPHGAYPCDGDDRWIAIDCATDEEWRSLVAVARHDEWLEDDRFATLECRLAHQEELDGVISEWTRVCERYQLMNMLQAAGVRAGVCQTAEDRVDRDPQLQELGWLTEVTGTRIGRWPVPELPFRMTATPPYIGGVIDRGAPCYGEDNEYVYGELLGMGGTEIERLAEDGVI